MNSVDLALASQLIPDSDCGKPVFEFLPDQDSITSKATGSGSNRPTKTKGKRSKQEWRPTTTPGLVYYVGSDGRKHYHGRLKVRGKPLRESLHTTKLPVARERFRKWRDKVDNSPNVEEGSCLDALFDPVMDEVKNRKGGSPNTYDCYKRCVQRLRTNTPDFIKISLQNLDATEDVAPALSILDKKYAGNTINNVLTVLYLTLKYAVKKGFMTRVQRLDLLDEMKTRPRGKRTPWLPEMAMLQKIRKIMYEHYGRCSGDSGPMFDTLWLTGARINSVRHLQVADVDFANNRIHFRIAKYGPYYQPLMPELREVLLAHIKRKKLGPNDNLFEIESVSSRLGRACRKLKIPHLCQHDMRHLFATLAIQKGVDIPTVASWLGHKDGGALLMETYSHLLDDHSQVQSKKMVFVKATWTPEQLKEITKTIATILIEFSTKLANAKTQEEVLRILEEVIKDAEQPDRDQKIPSAIVIVPDRAATMEELLAYLKEHKCSMKALRAAFPTTTYLVCRAAIRKFHEDGGKNRRRYQPGHVPGRPFVKGQKGVYYPRHKPFPPRKPPVQPIPVLVQLLHKTPMGARKLCAAFPGLTYDYAVETCRQFKAEGGRMPGRGKGTRPNKPIKPSDPSLIAAMVTFSSANPNVGSINLRRAFPGATLFECRKALKIRKTTSLNSSGNSLVTSANGQLVPAACTNQSA